jgi:maleylpyruvate isomerase
MPFPRTAIEGCRQSHQRLLADVAGLSDATARQPSLLPRWSVGHLLTHLARNADSVVRRLDGARNDVVVDQYPGGMAERAAEIEAGADRSAATLIKDVADSAARVEAACDSLDEDHWARPCRDAHGNLLPAYSVIFARWREVEVHHFDLGLGYQLENWPDALVERWLPLELDRLARRGDQHDLLAWTIGRAPLPDLSPWDGGFAKLPPSD